MMPAAPFTFLGFIPDPERAGRYIFHFFAHDRVIKIKSSVMNVPGNAGALIDIASSPFWLSAFPAQKGRDWRAAKLWMTQEQHKIGWYRAPSDGENGVHKNLTARKNNP